MPSSTYFTFHTSALFYLLRLAPLLVVLCKSMSTMAAGCPAVDYTRYTYTNICINLPTYWCAIYCHWEGRALFKLVYWKAITPASLCPAMLFADLGLLIVDKKVGGQLQFFNPSKNFKFLVACLLSNRIDPGHTMLFYVRQEFDNFVIRRSMSPGWMLQKPYELHLRRKRVSHVVIHYLAISSNHASRAKKKQVTFHATGCSMGILTWFIIIPTQLGTIIPYMGVS